MKKLLFFAFTLVLFACKEDATIDYAIISGKITNKEIGDVTINSYDITLTETLSVSEDGRFTDTLSTEISSYVLYDGKNPIFLHLEPGYNLTINYNAQDFDNSLSISGKGSETNNYLFVKRKNEQKLFGQANETYILSESQFKEKFLTIKKSQDSLLNNIKGIPEVFKLKEKRNLQYSYLNNILNYERIHKYFTKNEDFKVSDDFLDELKKVDYLNQEDYQFSNDYKNLLVNHYSKKADELAKSDSIENDIAFLKTVSSVTNESIKNGLLFDFANESMSYSKDLETFYNMFSTASTNEKNNTIITEKYHKLIVLNKGQPSPKFVDYKNYAGGTSSLDDLKGKYIYIDVWATWCGPCIGEIPSLKKVEEQFHDKNVEFVSISIDRKADFEKWKMMIQEKELKGVHLFADSDWSSSFVKDYQIQGIPRFILIDPDGIIVDSNAPRPSSPELIELFTSLNI